MRIYVGSLPYRATDQDLADLFGRIGQVVSATVIIDRDTGRSKGFGFVEMSNDQEARTAIDQLNGTTFGDRTIVVNEARDRRDQRWSRSLPGQGLLSTTTLQASSEFRSLLAPFAAA